MRHRNAPRGGAPGAHTRRGAPLRALAVVALALVALAPPAHAAAADGAAARVVWTLGDRAYVAAPDSGALAPRMRVHILEHGREIAAGEVTGVLHGTLADVRLTSGALEAGTRLDRLTVLTEPAPPRAPAALRIGAPSAARASLLFACGEERLDLASLPRAYRAETLAVDAFRLVGADSLAAAPEWPDTLLVRLFGDRADEEIALERGDLDAALFWPGEPSARLRDGAFGSPALRGARTRGVLVAMHNPADSTARAPTAADLGSFNAGMFGGDLQPWAPPDSASAAPAAARPAAWRYQVDVALPGQLVLERLLNRGLPPLARAGERRIFITLLDADLAARDSLETAWRRRGITPLFTLRCPLFCAPGRAADVRALGVDALAGLLACGPIGRLP